MIPNAAMFSFLSNGEWRDVIDEVGLPLSDRVAVALRTLSDNTLRTVLAEMVTPLFCL